MTVVHLNTLYRVTPIACGYLWRLTECGNPRNKITLNRQQMILAGFAHIVEKAA